MFLSYFCFSFLISLQLAFFLKKFHRLLLLLYGLPGTPNSQAPLKAPFLLNGGRKALLHFPHLSQTPTIAWSGFLSRGAFPSVSLKRSPDNSMRELNLEKINLTLSGEMKGFYLLELLCSKCGGELASSDRRKHITLQEERQAQPESNSLMASEWRASKHPHIFILPKLTFPSLLSHLVPVIWLIGLLWQRGSHCHGVRGWTGILGSCTTSHLCLSILRLQSRIQTNYCHTRKVFCGSCCFLPAVQWASEGGLYSTVVLSHCSKLDDFFSSLATWADPRTFHQWGIHMGYQHQKGGFLLSMPVPWLWVLRSLFGPFYFTLLVGKQPEELRALSGESANCQRLAGTLLL